MKEKVMSFFESDTTASMRGQISSSQPYHYIATSHRSRAPVAVEDGRDIMTVLRNWTEAYQSSPSNLSRNGVDFHKMANHEVCHNGQRVERKMTPDLIRVSPHPRTTDHGQLRESPLYYSDSFSSYQSQKETYPHNQVTYPNDHVTSSRQSMSSGHDNQLSKHVDDQYCIAFPQMSHERWSETDDPCYHATYDSQRETYQNKSKTSYWPNHGTPIFKEEIPSDPQTAFEFTPDRSPPAVSIEQLKVNETQGSHQSDDTVVNGEFCQRSLSQEFSVYKSCDSVQQQKTSDGLSISNPIYSDRANSEDGDFYSRENLRSISQTLIHDQCSPTDQNRSTSTATSWREDSAESQSILSSNQNDASFMPSVRTIGEMDARDVRNDSATIFYKRGFPVDTQNAPGAQHKSQVQSPSSIQNWSRERNLNDSLLSSPKFKALKEANQSVSAQSSPSFSRRVSSSLTKLSPSSTDQESKNSLNSSTLSIATSWSSGVGLPFPRSHSSSFSSQSQSQFKLENCTVRNLTAKWEDTIGARGPLPPLSDSLFIENNSVRNVLQQFATPASPSEISSGSQRVEHDLRVADGLNGHRSYIHPPLYPLIPRTQRNKDKFVSNYSVIPIPDIQSESHKCCSCSCHSGRSVPESPPISPPFPNLKDDPNNNARNFYGSQLSSNDGDGLNSREFGQYKPNQVNQNSSKENIPSDTSGKQSDWKANGDLSKRRQTSEALGHRVRSLSFPTTRAADKSDMGGKVDRFRKEYWRRENSVSEMTGDQQNFRAICENSPLETKDLRSNVSFHSDRNQNTKNLGKIRRAPAFRYDNFSVKAPDRHYNTPDVADDVCNHDNSPPNSPSRVPPPIPERDLSITISGKRRRSPLQLPSNAALYMPPYLDNDFSHTGPDKNEIATERRQTSFWGDGVKNAVHSDMDGREVNERSHTDDNIAHVNGVTLYQNVTQIDWDKITGANDPIDQRNLNRGPGDGFVESCSGGDEFRSVGLQGKRTNYSTKNGFVHDMYGSSAKMEDTSQLRQFYRRSKFPTTHSTILEDRLKQVKVKEISLGESRDSWKRLPGYHIENALADHSEHLNLSKGKFATGGQFQNDGREMAASVRDTMTDFSVPQEQLSHVFDKGSHHLDVKSLSQDQSSTSHYKLVTSFPSPGFPSPDLIPAAVVVAASNDFDEEEGDIGERVDYRGSKTEMENGREWSPVYRAPPLSEVKSPMQAWVESSVLQLELTEVDSVQQWLFDIRTNTDCESMCILQGKSIHNSPVNLEMTANTIKANVLKLKTASKCLSAKFSQLHQKLTDEHSHDLWHSCRITLQEIQSMTKECAGFFVEVPSAVISLQQGLLEECSKFKASIEESEVNHSNFVQSESHLTSQLINLGEQCALFVETVQTKLIQALVYSVQDSASEFNIMVSVKTVHALITDHPSIKQILLREQIASALFQVCLQTSFAVSSLQLLSLQTIAKLCQDVDGRIETEKIGGIGYLTQMISSPASSEALKIEAAALVGQLTAPETISEYSQTRIHQHLEILLKALTELMEQSTDPLVFLVISSAVANISFMGSVVYEYLAQQGAAGVLVEGWRGGKVDTLNAKDQLVTIFANMAEDQACREESKRAGGISLLITLLQTQVTEGDSQESRDQTEFEEKVCEQIQQKSAIALARLAKDVTCAVEIAVCDGIPIFARLCKTSSYRNKSVPVLIACLAALRRLHHALGPSSFQEEDIQKLIRPKMIDSIFACSSMSEESFV